MLPAAQLCQAPALLQAPGPAPHLLPQLRVMLLQPLSFARRRLHAGSRGLHALVRRCQLLPGGQDGGLGSGVSGHQGGGRR